MQNTKAHLLYVEDDESLSFVTRDNLELQGYLITYCADGAQALDVIKTQTFDLCILDVMLPEVDGFTIAKEIRKTNQEVPIIFLTAKSMKEDRIQGLKLGADDYLTKPFSIEELVLKIEIFLRRNRINPSSNAERQNIYSIGKYTFNHKNLELKCDEMVETLTQKEADLLRLLLENKNEVIKRSIILETLWGEDDYFLGRSMDVFISRLRKYLRFDPTVKIENIHGVGFKLKIS
ncbi:MAG: response regulator transcription factor [Saprospiraceae bacterium]|nr:response regulator transcription factor [Saprospiraceae bacterium]